MEKQPLVYSLTAPTPRPQGNSLQGTVSCAAAIQVLHSKSIHGLYHKQIVHVLTLKEDKTYFIVCHMKMPLPFFIPPTIIWPYHPFLDSTLLKSSQRSRSSHFEDLVSSLAPGTARRALLARRVSFQPSTFLIAILKIHKLRNPDKGDQLAGAAQLHTQALW